MNETGISVDEACAKRAELGGGYLTDEDFARQCNPDGTVKWASETTFSVQNSDTSVTASSTYVYVIAAVVVVAMALVAWMILRKRTPKVR